jgi:hypothetical protein
MFPDVAKVISDCNWKLVSLVQKRILEASLAAHFEIRDQRVPVRYLLQQRLDQIRPPSF